MTDLSSPVNTPDVDAAVDASADPAADLFAAPVVPDSSIAIPAPILAPVCKSVPVELRSWAQWLVWVAVWDPTKAKYSKVPYNANTYDGFKAYGASTTNPADWSTFDVAVSAYERSLEATPFLDAVVFAGIGFVLCDYDNFVGIDLDHAIGTDKQLTPAAFDIIGALDTYTEVSPSGTGIRMFARASLPPGRRKSRDVEMYESGRFLTITGRRWPGTTNEIEARQEQVEALHASSFPPPPPVDENLRPRSVPAVLPQNDNDLLELAFNAKNGAITRALYEGDMASAGGDHSAADLALINKLVFYTHDDPARLDRLFRNSSLMRDKWDQVRFANKETYGQRTIRLAIEGCKQFYAPPGTALAFEKFAASQSAPIPGTLAALAASNPGDLVLVAPELTDEQKRTAIVEGRRKEKAAKRAKRSEVVLSAGDLPIIECNDRHLRDVAQDAFNALVKANDPPTVFVRSGALVRITTNEVGVPLIGIMGESALRHRLARIANFVSTSDDRGTVPVAPGSTMINDIFAFPSFTDLPPLEGIVTAPVVAPDGTLMTSAGYLPKASVYHYKADEREIPCTDPTPENIIAAKELLIDTLLADFPFANESSKAHAMSLLLLPFVRPLIHGQTPLHLVDAPTQGTGKTLLVQVIGAVFVGWLPDAIGCPDKRDNEEWRKLITTHLGNGVSHIIFDNLKQRLDSASLAIALTAPQWTDRLLGTNTSSTIPIRCTWSMTANNADLDADYPRRCIWIRLDSKTERPELRDPNKFKVNDIELWVIAERPRLIAAALTLIRAWLESGQKDWTGRPLGGYISWSRVMGGILEAVGIPGFFGNREDLYERSDPDREKWAAFINEWYEVWKSAHVGASDIVGIATKHEIVAQDAKSPSVSLGRMLRAHDGTVFGNLSITRVGEKARAQQYKVRLVRKSEDYAPVRGESDSIPEYSTAEENETLAFASVQPHFSSLTSSSFNSSINKGQEKEKEEEKEREKTGFGAAGEAEELF